MSIPQYSWDEVESLQVGIRRALDELRHYRPRPCQEQGIVYHFDSLIGIMEIAANDAIQISRPGDQKMRAQENP